MAERYTHATVGLARAYDKDGNELEISPELRRRMARDLERSMREVRVFGGRSPAPSALRSWRR